MTLSIRQSLTLLCAAADVPLDGLDDDALNIIAIRLITECGDDPEFTCIGRIVDSVRRAEAATAATEEGTRAKDAECAAPASSVHPVSSRCPFCNPQYRAHTPSGGGFFHERTCTQHPHEKLRYESAKAKHDRDERVKQTASHQAEDVRATVIPIRRPGGSCAKCHAPTSRTYCRSCRQLLDAVKPRRA